MTVFHRVKDIVGREGRRKGKRKREGERVESLRDEFIAIIIIIIITITRLAIHRACWSFFLSVGRDWL